MNEARYLEFIGYDHGVQAEVGYAFFFQDAEGVEDLFTGHAVFGFFRRTDDIVAALKERARIITGANPIRQRTALFHEVDHGNVVEVDQSAEFHGSFKFFIRRVIGRKDDIMAGNANFVT